MNLKYLTDKQLNIDTLKLVGIERKTTAEILWHLKEIDERKLYSDLKCSSLFDYCVRILKYSEASASRRVSAARLLKTIPEIMPKIESGELSLTHLNLAAKTTEDKTERLELLTKMENKTTREAELLTLNPETPAREKIKQVSQTQKEIQLTISNETYEKLQKLKNKLSNKNISKLEDIINYALEAALTEKPTKIQAPRQNPTARFAGVTLKKIIMKRDHGKCTNCGSQHRLQIDHIKPYSIGGKTTAENLRLLCSNCNQRSVYYYNEEHGNSLNSSEES